MQLGYKDGTRTIIYQGGHIRHELNRKEVPLVQCLCSQSTQGKSPVQATTPMMGMKTSHLQIEFVPSQTSLFLFHSFHFVKCWQIFSWSDILKDCIQVQILLKHEIRKIHFIVMQSWE